MKPDPEEEARIAHDAIWAAKEEYKQRLTEAFPIGRHVAYRHGTNDILCEVIGHGSDDLVVRGLSGKRYRISGYRFLFK